MNGCVQSEVTKCGIYLLGRTRGKSEISDSSSGIAIARPFIGRPVGSAALLFLTGILLPTASTMNHFCRFPQSKSLGIFGAFVLTLLQIQNTVKTDTIPQLAINGCQSMDACAIRVQACSRDLVSKLVQSHRKKRSSVAYRQFKV
jgi:hypothetical protein